MSENYIKTTELHDAIFKLLIEHQVSIPEATITLSHVILNLGVMDIEQGGNTFNTDHNGDICYSSRSECKRVKLNIYTGDNMPADTTGTGESIN